MSNYDDIRNALTYIDSHDRETWIQVGAALKDELGDEGFNLWDSWSQGADNYNARDAKAAWKSFKPGLVHIGSLFYHARANGYRPDKPYTSPSPEEQARIQAEREAVRLAEEQARAERREQVKHLAQRIWAGATPAQISHPYLAAKGITDPATIAGLRQNMYQGDNNLLVPVYYNREIVNVQSINQDGGKRFLADGQVQGGFAVVGDAANTQNGIVIAEGFATAASIHQATGKTVIVAFNAGNMPEISERLAQNLPKDVPVVFAVDNDASQTGMKKALQAAAYFEGRAQVVEPEFTMAQIRRYQLENGTDDKGRPKLPSDFNDLHQLAGLDAVREKMESVFRRPETAPAATPQAEPIRAATPAMSDEEWAAVVAEEARLSGYSAPPPAEPPHQAASTEAASVLHKQEQEMNSNQHDAPETEATPEKPSENPLPENTIEYAALRQAKEPEPYQGVDPDHVFGGGRTADGVSGRAYYEGDFKHYEMYDPRINIQYLRKTPQEIQADLDNAGDIYGYEGLTHDGELVPFSKTDTGWESPLPGSAPEQTSEPDQAEKNDAVPEPEAATVKKPVTDLNYRIPPESIESRYVVAGGKYLSAANHTTVMFTDAGKKISTAKTDTQTINDMLEVAKEKGWDSIKISGNREFKSMMYVMAESRGIRTTGYRPKPEDLALLERMRQERSLNAIEPQPERAPTVEPVKEKVAPAPYPGDKRQRPSETQAGVAAKTATAAEVGERIVDVGTAHYRHNPNEQLSPYIVLESEGKERTVWGVDIPDAMARSGAEVGDRIRLHKLGKQPVEIEVAVRDENGQVTGTEKKEVKRNLFRMEIVQDNRQQQEKETPAKGEQKVSTKPDVEMLSKADKMMAQNELPSDATINSSQAADTQLGVPLQAVGQSEIRSEVVVQANRMKTAALETNFISARSVYMEKAAKLSKANKQHLQWHERNVLDTIRGLKGDARTLALTNYYEHTAKQMSGTKLKLPKPIKQPAYQQTPPRQTTERNQRQDRSQSKEMEVER
ncbi:PriCT-2 domain-containing protein [Neisseria sp. Dent CA1/247]|uniref:LPD7 domain-containing protein n=1 Tax=Neisseria sp. Dent CA1/247 TaxID=2912675 RepID=UPI001FD1021B|nr:LPD7 domain-containing protein [Neisseria sp. Dent CA1/247]UOO76518.1 PriCT-2 domain-containing protein [Neisseria sp. Dent CA1/247]